MPSTEDYTSALFNYCLTRGEEALYEASQLSAAFIQEGFGPDEIVAIHFESVQEVSRNPAFKPTERVRVLNDAHQFLLEIMIGYGAQYKEFLELRLAAAARRAETAERSEREKLELFAMFAHELGNPLTIALGNMQIAARFVDTQDLDNLRILVADSRDALERLAHLTRQIVTASRGELTPLNLEPVDLRVSLTKAVEWAARAAKSKGVNLVVEDGDEPVPVNADQESLASLVDNLLSNAIRYTPEGGTVTATCGRSGEGAWLQVSDTGIGIPDEELAQVFGKFYRGDRARRMIAGGLGMGLHIVQHVASNHGGSVEVTSELGKGSTFRFTLPLLELESEE
jgi:signal transduction histidine kinase